MLDYDVRMLWDIGIGVWFWDNAIGRYSATTGVEKRIVKQFILCISS